MPLVKTITPDKAEGRVKEIYDTMKEKLGMVPNGLQMYSASPPILELQFQYMGYFMKHPKFSFPFLTLIRLLVAQEKNCQYCIGMNTTLLLNAGITMEQINKAKKNPSDAPLDDNEKALLLFTLKAVQSPRDVTKDDIEKLKKLSWSDQDIFDATRLAALSVATDILFDTFKVEKD